MRTTPAGRRNFAFDEGNATVNPHNSKRNAYVALSVFLV
jgi:hypothetical protein